MKNIAYEKPGHPVLLKSQLVNLLWPDRSSDSYPLLPEVPLEIFTENIHFPFSLHHRLTLACVKCKQPQDGSLTSLGKVSYFTSSYHNRKLGTEESRSHFMVQTTTASYFLGNGLFFDLQDLGKGVFQAEAPAGINFICFLGQICPIYLLWS